MDDLKSIIKSLEFFTHFSTNDINRMISFFEVRKYQKDYSIIDENTVNTSLFFLIEGSVNIYVDRRCVSSESQYGEVFGEMSISGQNASFAKLKSKGESTFLVFNFLALHEIPEARRDHLEKLIYKSFSEVLTNRLVKANQRVERYRSRLKIKKSA